MVIVLEAVRNGCEVAQAWGVPSRQEVIPSECLKDADGNCSPGGCCSPGEQRLSHGLCEG